MIQRGGDEQEAEAEERQKGWGAGLFKRRREGYSNKAKAVPSQHRTCSLRLFLINLFLLLSSPYE
jgi:hypothetical protein